MTAPVQAPDLASALFATVTIPFWSRTPPCGYPTAAQARVGVLRPRATLHRTSYTIMSV